MTHRFEPSRSSLPYLLLNVLLLLWAILGTLGVAGIYSGEQHRDIVVLVVAFCVLSGVLAMWHARSIHVHER